MTITVLISGRGSNMVAIHQASMRSDLNASVSHVISNDPNAAGLEYARQHGISTSVIDHREFTDRNQFDARLQQLTDRESPSLILLAGFMRKLGASFARYFEGRLINIHPSLLPRHPGLNTHEKALQTPDSWHGCSVHFVTDVLDGGPIIARSPVPVQRSDTPDTLASRVLVKEHALYWQIAGLVLEGHIRWQDGHVEYYGKRLIYPLTL